MAVALLLSAPFSVWSYLAAEVPLGNDDLQKFCTQALHGISAWTAAASGMTRALHDKS
jgi:hypothetical protein